MPEADALKDGVVFGDMEREPTDFVGVYSAGKETFLNSAHFFGVGEKDFCGVLR